MSTERPPLEDLTLRQLRRIASEYGISRYSRMRKDQLLSSIQEIQRTRFAPSPSRSLEAQAEVEAAKFDVGQVDRSTVVLTAVDEGLADLPDGYGESRIVLMPRDPQWAYTYWDIPNDHKEALRRQGGSRIALRFYDVTDINLEAQRPHSLQQYECDELAREWYLPIPVSDRDYMVEIGYLTMDGRWLLLARSAPVRIPPVYPSDWIEDQFITISWEENLQGKTFLELSAPTKRSLGNPIYDRIFGLSESTEAQRVAGSLFGSMHQVPEQAVSSYVFPSGMGIWTGAVPTASGMGMSGVGMSGLSAMTTSGIGALTTSGMGMAGMTMSGIGMSGMTMSGIGMSGVGMMNMSGAGFSASAPPIRPRQFWLIADAELIVYGATEPDATVTIGGRPIQLNSDGTFRFQMAFQDGQIDFPIFAVAADGEQNRAIHMKFNRETLERRTNTKEEAVEEWLLN
ncbi:MAG: DUF4912 domain-containing protein [Oculatellaceae cyanobacterium Prado106]|nr:DUF4912 domain-containing protein [Oculatellaceae cyanobacterium Prado106]